MLQAPGLLHRHSGLRAFIHAQQEQLLAAAAGGQDHPLAEAEAHLARREVGDEHHLPADQLRGIGIRGNGNRERDVCGVSSASASGHIMVTR